MPKKSDPAVLCCRESIEEAKEVFEVTPDKREVERKELYVMASISLPFSKYRSVFERGGESALLYLTAVSPNSSFPDEEIVSEGVVSASAVGIRYLASLNSRTSERKSGAPLTEGSAKLR